MSELEVINGKVEVATAGNLKSIFALKRDDDIKQVRLSVEYTDAWGSFKRNTKFINYKNGKIVDEWIVSG